MSSMDVEERWFYVWLSIYLVPLGTAPFIIWEWKHPVWGTICCVVGLTGLLMLVRDRITAATSKWPRVSLKALAVVTLSVLFGQLLGYDITGHRVSGALSSLQSWFYGLGLLLIVVVVSATLSKSKPSKLVIHSANYRAVENGGEEFDVGDFLQQIISGDSLVFDIENHNFKVNGKDYVPRDPLTSKVKRVKVSYSYGSEPARTTERREHGRLLLPEDSKITWLMGEVERLTAAQQQPLPRTSQPRNYPRPIFTLEKVILDGPSTNPQVVFKNKIRIILTNHFDRDVSVWTPLWESTETMAQGSPLGSTVQLAKKGWEYDEWEDEYRSIVVPVGRSFRTYVPVQPTIGRSIAERMRTGDWLGTAIIPTKVDGKLYEIPIDIGKKPNE